MSPNPHRDARFEGSRWANPVAAFEGASCRRVAEGRTPTATSRFCSWRVRKSATPSTTPRCSVLKRCLPACRTGVKAVVLAGEGEQFCSGLDLARAKARATSHRASRIRAAGIARSPRSSLAACRWWRCCMARWSAAGWSSRLPPHPRRRTFGLLCAAGGQPRHLCRRRRIGPPATANRRLADEGLDADRPHLRCGGGPGDRAVALSSRAGQRSCQGHRARQTHRR